jgi:hypothetical protein
MALVKLFRKNQQVVTLFKGGSSDEALWRISAWRRHLTPPADYWETSDLLKIKLILHFLKMATVGTNQKRKIIDNQNHFPTIVLKIRCTSEKTSERKD